MLTFLPDPGDRSLEEALSVCWCGFVPKPKLQLQSAPNLVEMSRVLRERKACGFTLDSSIGGAIARKTPRNVECNLSIGGAMATDSKREFVFFPQFLRI